MRIPFTKPFLDIDDQIKLLRNRGLKISDLEKAKNYLKRIGYYRLSGYWYPLRESQIVKSSDGTVSVKILDNFRSGSEFSQVVDLYVFDKKLRLLFLDALPGIRAANQTAILNAPVKTISAAYTVLTADNGWLLERDASAGNDTVTLPAVAGLVDGWVIGIKKTDATPNAVTIDANGSELIDGLLTLSLLNQYDTVWLAKKSGAWSAISAI